jgi:tRNA-Thr(GGU) m(6)t(6)A37 methyltransferase TsaA
MSPDSLTVSPVGKVVSGPDGFAVTIDEPFRAALHGIEEFSHLQVLWWAHLAGAPGPRDTLECEQPYRMSPRTLGVFATRSPIRPVPIALSTVTVLSVDAATGTIRVTYLDAEPGTPVLDIKPYHPCTDRVRSVSVPSWCAHWPRYFEDSGAFDWEAEFVTAR